MANKTRKHIWPGTLVMAIAVAGILAAFLVLANNPSVIMAQDAGDPCAGMTETERAEFIFGGGKCGAPDGGNSNGNDPPAGTMLKSSSTSGGAGIMLTLTIKAADMEDLVSGDRIEIYLEDDYSVPDSISASDVYFRVPGGGVGQNNGGRVNAADVSIDDDDHFTADKDDLAIAILVPDMDPRDDEFGYPVANRDLVVVIEKDAGIKNPTEQGTHSNGYSILTGSESDNAGPGVTLAVLNTWAKISLSASDGGRDKEVTVIGSGFNNGTEAEVFVLDRAPMVAEWWDTLDCAAMAMYDPMNTDDDETNDRDANPENPYCKMYGMLGDTEKDVVDAAFRGSDRAMCVAVVEEGSSLGTAGVGSDHKFTVNFTVHQDEFTKGNVNYICATDNEAPANRVSSAAKMFDLTPSITVSPSEVSSGDEVTLKPRDFEDGTASVSLNGEKIPTLEMEDPDYVFDMPGGVSGVVQISFTQGEDTKRTTITVNPSKLELSKTEVAPNESIIITGSGFNENVKILVKDIKIDGESLDVSNAGTQGTGDDRYVQTTSSGEFTATVRVWAMGDDNPTLDHDTYTIKVTDEMEFVGKAKITILEPTVSVMPEMVSPRDFITISGENWPISTSDRRP